MMILDPRTKFLATVAVIISTFLAREPYSFTTITGLFIVVFIIAKAPFRIYMRNILLLSWLLLFTLFINLWGYSAMQHTSLGNFGESSFLSGALAGGLAVGRLILVVGWVTILAASSSPLQLVNALEHLLTPFHRLGIPVQKLSIITMLSLRFIPILFEESQHLIHAHIARGIDFSSGRLAERLKNYTYLCIPLFTSLLRRVDHLTQAMDARAFRAGAARTSLHLFRMNIQDYVVLTGSIILVCSSIFLVALSS